MEPDLQEALNLAVALHKGTYRDGDDPLPYATHPVEVAALLRHVGGVRDPHLLCAAFLHDTVEDSGLTVEGIRSRFGDRVADLVGEVTRWEPSETEVAGLAKSEVWRLRADALLKEIAQMGPEAQLIKLADRLSNIRDCFRTKRGEKQHRYAWHTRRILEIIPRDRNPGLWDAIQAEVDANPVPAKSAWATNEGAR